MVFDGFLKTHCCDIKSLLEASWTALGKFLGRFWGVLGRFWGVLGRSWPLLGRSWGALGRSWGTLGPLLGRSGAVLGHLGAILKPQEPIGSEKARRPKTLIPYVLERSWPLGDVLKAFRRHPGDIQGPSWQYVGGLWPLLGSPWSLLGTF